jgi:hypothetical protein
MQRAAHALEHPATSASPIIANNDLKNVIKLPSESLMRTHACGREQNIATAHVLRGVRLRLDRQPESAQLEERLVHS